VATESLPDGTKIKLIKALQAQEKASAHLRKCLEVRLKGFGLEHSSAIRAAETSWNRAVQAVKTITSETIRPEGLLQEGLEEMGLGQSGDSVDLGDGATLTRVR
jgi:hypothetical protein